MILTGADLVLGATGQASPLCVHAAAFASTEDSREVSGGGRQPARQQRGHVEEKLNILISCETLFYTVNLTDTWKSNHPASHQGGRGCFPDALCAD